MVKLFISHSHQDWEIASLLVDVITSFYMVPEGELLCTSVPGHQLSLGGKPEDTLPELLRSTELVIALLSVNSLFSEWVLFELGAAWVLSKRTIPLLIGTLSNEDIPASLQGTIAGKISDPRILRELVYTNIKKELNWDEGNRLSGENKIDNLVEKASSVSSSLLPREIRKELIKSDREKINNLADDTQIELFRYLESNNYPVEQSKIASTFDLSERETYFRLENLRILGLICRTEIGKHVSGKPRFNYSRSQRLQ